MRQLEKQNNTKLDIARRKKNELIRLGREVPVEIRKEFEFEKRFYSLYSSWHGIMCCDPKLDNRIYMGWRKVIFQCLILRHCRDQLILTYACLSKNVENVQNSFKNEKDDRGPGKRGITANSSGMGSLFRKAQAAIDLLFSHYQKYLDLVLIYVSDLMISIANLRLPKHPSFED